MTEAYRSSQAEETTRGIFRDRNNSDAYTLLPSPNTNSAEHGICSCRAPFGDREQRH